ncbi:MAG: Verru_Chthon cassette protein B [Verrucomicrobiales bacterium]
MIVAKIKKRVSRAFSLVEVTIAMAIAALGIVSILGLLPQGMDTMVAAGDEAIQARIHQQLLNEIQMTPYKVGSTSSPIDEFDGLELYYDDQGEEIGDGRVPGEIKGSREHIYSARVTLPPVDDTGRGSGNVPDSVGGASFNGVTLSDDQEYNKYIRPVIIEVAVAGALGDKFDWDADEYRKMISTYQTYIVQMGHDFSAATP